MNSKVVNYYTLLINMQKDENKTRIAKSDALKLLVDLAKSKDQRVQRNATGALLNMTHTRKYMFILRFVANTENRGEPSTSGECRCHTCFNQFA